MKKLVFSLAVAVGALSMVAEAEVPTRAYIQEGLIAHWDGIENAGAGKEHAETSANWVDLKQGAGIKSNATGDSFDGRYFIAANVARTTSQHLSSAEPLTEATFEAFSQPLSIIATKAFHNQLISFKSIGSLEFDSTLGGFSASAFMSDEASGTTPCSFDSGYGDLSEIVAAGALQTYAARIATGSCRGSVNGEPRRQTEGRKPTEVFVSKSAADTRLSFGGANLTTKTGSLRVYNRQLSDAELFHNHKIDRARFEDDASCVRVNGDKLQYRIRITCDARLGTVSVNGGEAQSGTIDLWVDEDGTETTLTFTATERVRAFRGWKGANVSEDAAKALTITVSPLIMDIEPLVWSGKTHSIPSDFASVAEATAADDVLDGDTLILEDGTYTFDQIASRDVVHKPGNGALVTNEASYCVILRRPLKLIGSSPEKVVLDCGGFGGLLVDHPDAQVSNLTITNFMMKTGSACALNVNCGKVDHLVVDGLDVKDGVPSNLSASAIYGGPGAVFEDCSFLRIRSDTGANSHYVLSAYGSVFRGLTMKGCKSNDFVYLSPLDTGCRTRFEDCVFTENTTKSNQAYFQGRNGDFVRCDVVGNIAPSGSINVPLFSVQLTWTFDRCVITGNLCTATSPLFSTAAGGNAAAATKLYFTNCLVANNQIKGQGVIRLSNYAVCEVVQSTIVNNSRNDADQAVAFTGDGASGKTASVRLVNSVFWNNTSNGIVKEFAESYPYTNFEVSNCCFSPDSSLTGENVTSRDPDFVAIGAGDYHLGHASSCIDTGLELAATDVDLEGKARPVDGTGSGTAAWDIGCYEAETPTTPLLASVTLHDDEGVAPASPALSVTVTGSKLTGLSYEWWAIRDAAGELTTNVVSGVGADYTFADLPLGKYVFASVVRNDQGDAVTNVTDKTFLSLAETAYVSTTGSSVWPYATPETAARELADAVAVARNVRVLPGRYAFTHRVDEITETECLAAINRGVSVVGDADPAQVVIDCGRKGGFVLNHPAATLSGMTFANSQIEADTSSTVNIQAGAISNVVVCGSEEAARPMPFVYVGEGASATELVVTNCLVTVQSSTAAGFALVQLYGGRLKNARIASCSVTMRALRAERTDASVRSYVENVSICDNDFRTYYVDKCVFLKMSDVTELSVCRNTADSGKGYLVSMGGCRVERSRFVGNSGKGVILCDAPGEVGAKGYLVNSLVMGNTCSTVAAVSHVSSSSRDFTIESCTIANNMAAAEAAAGGVRAPAKDQHGSKMTLLNTIVFGNTVDGQPNDVGVPDETLNFEASYSCFRETSLYPAANNLSADPMLKPNGKLTGRSACIDAGLVQPWHATGTDLDGNARIIGKKGLVDMGCYETRTQALILIFK